MNTKKWVEGFGIYSVGPDLKTKKFKGAAEELGIARARALSRLYHLLSNDKTHAPHAIKKTFDKLQIKFPCTVVFFNSQEEEREKVTDEKGFLNILRKGPSLNMQSKDEEYELSIIEE